MRVIFIALMPLCWACGLALHGPGVLPLAVAGMEEYWRVTEFLAAYPREADKMQAFAERVTAKPAPMASRDMAAPKPPRQKTTRIAVVYPAEQASDYWRRSVAALEGRLREAGFAYTLRLFTSRPTIEVRKQAEQLRQALDFNPDYLVFTLDARLHRRLIDRVLARGQPKLILQNVTTPPRVWDEHPPFLYVGFDHVQGSEMLAEFYAKTFAGQADYAVICRAPGLVAEQRGSAFLDYLEDFPGMRQRAFFYAGSERQEGLAAASHALKQYPDLDFIYTCATDLALGTLDALAEHGGEDLPLVNGWGGGAVELAAIRDGRLAVTVMRMNDDNGVAMAAAIRLDRAGRTAEVPRIFAGAFRLITPQTAKTTLQDLMQQAFRYSDPQPLAAP